MGGALVVLLWLGAGVLATVLIGKFDLERLTKR
jgi:hypothetical protein